MDVVGEGSIVFIDPADETPHQPLDNPFWQESVVIYVWDTQQQCYAFLRLGHEPNKSNAVIWSNIWVPGRQYKYTDTIPLQSGDRMENGFAAGQKIRYHFDGQHHWQVNDGEVSASFVMIDSHQPFDFFQGQNLGSVAPHHIEASGTVSGEITFGGKTYTLTNAIGHRDHSWGIRKWESIRTHRWAPAIFANGFSLNAMSFLGEAGELRQFGFIVRDNKLIVPENVSVVTHLEADGHTTRSGEVSFTMPDDEILHASYRSLVPSPISPHNTYPCNDALCEVHCDGQVGVGVFESGGNPTGGSELPQEKNLICGHIDNGIFNTTENSCFIEK